VPGLDWTSREVVDHLCNTLAFYANHAVQEARAHQPRLRSLGDRALSDADMAETVRTWTRLLALVIASKQGDWRGWHPLGMTDGEGFIALACNELLIHSHDVAAAHGQPFAGAEKFCGRLLHRLFPNDAEEIDNHGGWAVLLYVNGRQGLGRGIPRKAAWRSHPSPRRVG